MRLPYATHQTSPSLLSLVSAIANFNAFASRLSDALKLFFETPSEYRLLSVDGAARQIPSQSPSFELIHFPSLLPHSL